MPGLSALSESENRHPAVALTARIQVIKEAITRDQKKALPIQFPAKAINATSAFLYANNTAGCYRPDLRRHGIPGKAEKKAEIAFRLIEKCAEYAFRDAVFTLNPSCIALVRRQRLSWKLHAGQ
jgi:hypothetical protein